MTPMLHTGTMFHGNQPSVVPKKKIFKGFLPYMVNGHDYHLGHVTLTNQLNFHSPMEYSLHMQFGFNPSSSF